MMGDQPTDAIGRDAGEHLGAFIGCIVHALGLRARPEALWVARPSPIMHVHTHGAWCGRPSKVSSSRFGTLPAAARPDTCYAVRSTGGVGSIETQHHRARRRLPHVQVAGLQAASISPASTGSRNAFAAFVTSSRVGQASSSSRAIGAYGVIHAGNGAGSIRGREWVLRNAR